MLGDLGMIAGPLMLLLLLCQNVGVAWPSPQNILDPGLWDTSKAVESCSRLRVEVAVQMGEQPDRYSCGHGTPAVCGSLHSDHHLLPQCKEQQLFAEPPCTR